MSAFQRVREVVGMDESDGEIRDGALPFPPENVTEDEN